MADFRLLALEDDIVPLGPERASEDQAESDGKDENPSGSGNGTNNRGQEDEEATQHEHCSPIKRAPAERIPAFLKRHDGDVVARSSKRKTGALIYRSAAGIRRTG